MTRTYEDLLAWQKAHQFVVLAYSTIATFPSYEQFGLCSQFRRAAVSIAANICEGYRKIGKMDKLRFMNIAQGSLEECRYYIILSHDIGYIDEDTYQQLDYMANGVSWKLNGYAEAINLNKVISDD